MKNLFFASLATLIICLFLARFVEPSFKVTDLKQLSNSKSAKDEARVKETIRQMLGEYKSRNQKLLEEFEQRLNRAGNAGFNKARANVRPFVSNVTTFSFCSKMCYAMAKDKFNKTHTAMDMLAPEISSMVVAPCEEGQAEIVYELNAYLLKAQENDTRFKAGIAQLLEKENFTVLDLGLRDDFLESNMELVQKVQSYAWEKTLTAAGVGIEILFIKTCYQCLSSAFAASVSRRCAAAAAGGTCAVADGPAPFGDIVGGTIVIVGTAWMVHDIYRVTKKLPAEMRSYMTTMIDNYERDIRQKALERARTVQQLCDDSCLEISDVIEK